MRISALLAPIFTLPLATSSTNSYCPAEFGPPFLANSTCPNLDYMQNSAEDTSKSSYSWETIAAVVVLSAGGFGNKNPVGKIFGVSAIVVSGVILPTLTTPITEIVGERVEETTKIALEVITHITAKGLSGILAGAIGGILPGAAGGLIQSLSTLLKIGKIPLEVVKKETLSSALDGALFSAIFLGGIGMVTNLIGIRHFNSGIWGLLIGVLWKTDERIAAEKLLADLKPKKATDQDIADICPICHEAIKRSQIIYIHTTDNGVNHNFHYPCMLRWAENKIKRNEPPTCPTCTAVI